MKLYKEVIKDSDSHIFSCEDATVIFCGAADSSMTRAACRHSVMSCEGARAAMLERDKSVCVWVCVVLCHFSLTDNGMQFDTSNQRIPECETEWSRQYWLLREKFSGRNSWSVNHRRLAG